MKKFTATININKEVTLFAPNKKAAEGALLIELTDDDIQVEITEVPTTPETPEYKSLRDLYSSPAPKSNYTPLLKPASNYVRFSEV